MQDFERKIIENLGRAVTSETLPERRKPKAAPIPTEAPPVPSTSADNMKTCTKCGIAKERGEFYPNKNTKDGLAYTCKACSKALAKAHYNARRAAAPEKPSQATPAPTVADAEPASLASGIRQLSEAVQLFTDQQLAAELWARGWKFVATKTLSHDEQAR